MSGSGRSRTCSPGFGDQWFAINRRTQKLFLLFFVPGALPAPFAKFLELYFPLNFLFIFPRPIIDAFANAALELD